LHGWHLEERSVNRALIWIQGSESFAEIQFQFLGLAEREHGLRKVV
jgi:hypothetical protein